MSARSMGKAQAVGDRALRAILSVFWFACDWWAVPVAALVLYGLVGCAAAPTAPGVVKVPVAVPCQTQIPPRPAFAADTLTGDEDIWTIGTALWADRKARAAWEIDIETRLKGCIDGAEP